MSRAEEANVAANDQPLPLGYYSFGQYLHERYGCKVHKVSLHAGFTCPNRDGHVGVGGCTYCANESFSPQAGKPHRPIREQMSDGIEYMRRRYRAKKFFAYFQAFSNTYAPVERLCALYDEAADFPDVVGISIGTRPDCVPDEVLDLVQSYTDRLEVWLEYGIQTIHDRTLLRVNRGHDFATFKDAVQRTKGRNVLICAHVILGLPGESHEEMMETADALQALGIDGIKLHHLYIARGTVMETEYNAGEVKLFQPEEYVRTACDFLERIPRHVVVQRLVGDTTSGHVLVAPSWPQTKTEILRMFTEEFTRRGTSQGCRVRRPSLARTAPKQ
jgi:hypothetical protein